MVKLLTLDDISNIKKALQNQIAKHNIETGGGFTFRENNEWGESAEEVMGQSLFKLRFITFEVLFKIWQTPIAFSFKLVDEQRELYEIYSWPNPTGTIYKKPFESLVNRYNRVTKNFTPFTKAKPVPATELQEVKGFEEILKKEPLVKFDATDPEKSLRNFVKEYRTIRNAFKIFTSRGEELFIRLPLPAIVKHFELTEDKLRPAGVKHSGQFTKALITELENNQEDVLDLLEYIFLRHYNTLIETKDKSVYTD